MHTIGNDRAWHKAILCAGMALLGSTAAALGLGELERNAALGQPLSVDIGVFEESGEPELLKVRVADEAGYAALGLVRDTALEGAAVRLIQRDGRALLQISGRHRMQEPVLDLVLEASHLGTRVQRVYTVLLDPPGLPVAAPMTLAALPATAISSMGQAAHASAGVRGELSRQPRRHARTSRREMPVAIPRDGLTLSLRDAPISPPPIVKAVYVTAAARAPRLQFSERLLRIPAPRPALAAATSTRASATLRPAASQMPTASGDLWFSPAFWLLALALPGLLWLRLRRSGAAAPRSVEQWRALPPPVELPLPMQHPVDDASAEPSTVHGRQGTGRRRGDGLHAAGMSRGASLLEPAPSSASRRRDSEARLAELPPSPNLSGEAAELIAATLAAAPGRNDLRYKLLELHHAEGHADAFTEQAELFAHQLTGRDDAHWPAVQRMGRDLAPEHALFAIAAEPLMTDAGTARVQRFHEAVDSRRLKGALDALREGHQRLRQDPAFIAAFLELMSDELGRPTALQPCHALSQHNGGAMLHLKREDLRPRHSDGLIHVYGQVLLAKYMGKKTVVAACRQGQHGAALATAAAALGMQAVVYLPRSLLALDDHASVRKMRALETTLLPFGEEADGSAVDGRRLALEHWLERLADTSYVSPLRAGPAPMPEIITDFHCVVGQEVRRNWLRRFGRLPEALVCHIGAGYKTFGFMQPFLGAEHVAIESVSSATRRDDMPPEDDDAATFYRRELAALYAGNQVAFPTVSRRAASEAARLCGVHEGFEISADNACVLAQGLKLAKALTSKQSVVLMFG